MKMYVISVGTFWGWFGVDEQTTLYLHHAKTYGNIEDAWKKALEIGAPAVYEIEAFRTKVFEDGEWKIVATPQGER